MTLRELRRRYIRIEDGYRVARSRGDACVFFRRGECAVYAVRPVPCRTWPFWPEVMSRSDWAKEVLGFCPGAGKGRLHFGDAIREALRMKRAHDRDLEEDR
jgi:Fe-S-cluster containining protein